MKVPILNPMIFYPRFPHITEQIFQQLDNKTLGNCRETSKSWMTCINDNNLSWLRIVNAPKLLRNGDTYLHLATKIGQKDLFELILEIEEVKNPKNNIGQTPFHISCQYGHSYILEIFLEKSINFKIELSSHDGYGWKYESSIGVEKKIIFGSTPLHLASYYGHPKVVSILIQKSSELNIDLNAKIISGWTAFHMACINGHSKTAEILIQKSAGLNIDLNSKDENR